MADKTFRCTVITPEARVLDAEVTYASVPMHDGQQGVMHLSGAVVGKLGPGELRVEFAAGEPRRWFIEGGFMQNVDDALTILASGAVEAGELDITEVKAELAEAIARTSSDTEQMDKITAERDRARAKLAVATR
jgi:F-type H+-transporting ATPase subunit epsilon